MDLPVRLLVFRAYIEKCSRFIKGINLDSPAVEGVGARTHLEALFSLPAMRNGVLADFASVVVQVHGHFFSRLAALSECREAREAGVCYEQVEGKDRMVYVSSLQHLSTSNHGAVFILLTMNE
jgi:hypothetical protein